MEANAKSYCDKHIVKMPTEYCQMLSTSHRILDGATDEILYKQTHANHPCTIWCRESLENYEYLVQLTKSVIAEYTYRYEKVPKWITSGLVDFLSTPPKNIPSKGLTEFPLAMDEQYKLTDAVLSYRNYFNKAKTHLFKWKKREIPSWVTNQ